MSDTSTENSPKQYYVRKPGGIGFYKFLEEKRPLEFSPFFLEYNLDDTKRKELQEFKDVWKNKYCIFKPDESSFIKAIFEQMSRGDYDFSGYTFNNFNYPQINYKNANFSFAKFGREVSFEEAVFEDVTNFVGVEFCSNALFYKAVFENKVSFERAKFGGEVRFWQAEFENHVSFTWTHFKSAANFWKVQFKDKDNEKFKVDFGNAVFEDLAFFSDAKFYGEVSFVGVVFQNLANFEDVKFKSFSSFKGAVFARSVIFSKAEFTLLTYFDYVKFNSETNFLDSQFHGTANFEKAKFNKFTTFENATFGKKENYRPYSIGSNEISANFKSVDFEDRVTFENSTFHYDVSFKNSKFECSGIFDKTTFAFVPDFRFMSYKNSNFRFDTAKIASVLEMLKKLQDTIYHLKPEQYSELQFRFKAIKELAIASNDHKSDVYFYGEELEAARRSNVKSSRCIKRFFESIRNCKLFIFLSIIMQTAIKLCNYPKDKIFNRNILYGLYKHLSNYGRSLWRPFLWWSLTSVALVLFLFSCNYTNDPELIPFIGTLITPLPVYSYEHISNFLKTTIYVKSYCSYSYLAHFLSEFPCLIIHIGIILLKLWNTLLTFLLLLALRNEFRIRG